MKKSLCILALIGLFVTALVPAPAPADNEPPYWMTCPTSTTTTTTPTTDGTTTTEPTDTTTTTTTTCPEQPPTTP